jgi:hypothetical protein
MIYNILSFLAPVFVPIAPVIFFGWKVYTAVQTMTKSPWLSIPAGALTAFGLEAVGILAGHVGMVAWRRGDNRTAVIAAVIMAAYVGIGSWELRGSVGMVVFWIAPLVYVLVALQELVKQDTQQDGTRLAFDLEQQALDNEAKRALKAELALAKLAQASIVPAVMQNNASNAAHECEKCGRKFNTVQALNAHIGRWCKAVTK